jgi:hypothetical protein
MQKGIKSSEADPVPVPRKLLGHFESKDGAFDGVMKNMETDKARVKIAVLEAVIGIAIRYRHSIAFPSVSHQHSVSAVLMPTYREESDTKSSPSTNQVVR